MKDKLMLRLKDNTGYTPAYTRTDLTAALHEAFGFAVTKANAYEEFRPLPCMKLLDSVQTMK